MRIRRTIGVKMDKLSKQNLQVALDTYRKTLPKDLDDETVDIILEEIDISSRFLYDEIIHTYTNANRRIKKVGGVIFKLDKYDYLSNEGLEIYIAGGIENV